MAGLPVNYFDDSSDSDGSTSTTNTPTAVPKPCNPTTINELSTTTSSSDESTTDPNEPTRVRRKKRKKVSRKRERTPDETDEEEQRRLQRNARQGKRRADEKKNHQLTREKLAALENRRKSDRVWKQQVTKILGSDFKPTLNNRAKTQVFAGSGNDSYIIGSESDLGLASGAETETTGYLTYTSLQNIDQSTYLPTYSSNTLPRYPHKETRQMGRMVGAMGTLTEVSSTGFYPLRGGPCGQHSVACDTAESDYSGYLTDVSKDPFMS